MAITASQVKELRTKTGVGMMECKKALVENDGDLEKAILWLRERGMSRAAKKADRAAAEGIVEVLINDASNMGVLVEVNCETDFAGKNEDFRAFTKKAAEVALANKTASAEALLETKMGDQTVGDALTALIATVGENMKLRRVNLLSADNGIVAGYSHMGGKISTLVALEGATGDDIVTLGKDVAMHIAAAAPKYLNRDGVDTTELEQEKELARKKLIEDGKPEEMIEKILVGQMNKFFTEVCLVDQPFVKEPKISITKHVKAAGNGATIKGFTRFQLGDGVEKKEENFAEEVAAQLK